MNPAPYIGLPFADRGRGPEAFDCWGLYRWVLRREWGVALPSYAEDYPSALELAEVAALIRRESLVWGAVPRGGERPGDMVVLRLRGDPWHVGLITEPGWMLHIHRRTDSIHERYDSTLWRHRVQHIQRPPQLCG
ncbi:MAG: C40 family peptidase [Thiohalospira sp.]